jgi:hypothetical protein
VDGGKAYGMGAVASPFVFPEDFNDEWLEVNG